MKFLSTILLDLSLVLPAMGSRVTGIITNSDGTAYSGPLTVWPITPNLLADGSFVIRGIPQRPTATNGAWGAPVMRGCYAASNGVYRLCFAIPQDTGTYSAESNAIPGMNIFVYRPGVSADTVSAMIAASAVNTNGSSGVDAGTTNQWRADSTNAVKTLLGQSNNLSGTFTGNGAGLTNLTLTNIVVALDTPDTNQIWFSNLGTISDSYGTYDLSSYNGKPFVWNGLAFTNGLGGGIAWNASAGVTLMTNAAAHTSSIYLLDDGVGSVGVVDGWEDPDGTQYGIISSWGTNHTLALTVSLVTNMVKGYVTGPGSRVSASLVGSSNIWDAALALTNPSTRGAWQGSAAALTNNGPIMFRGNAIPKHRHFALSPGYTPDINGSGPGPYRISSGIVYNYITNLAHYPDAVACGWDVVSLGDGWNSNRVNGVMQVNPNVWTNDMASLVNMAHTNGLLMTTYSSYGNLTDQFTVGSPLQYVYGDIQQFMNWGFDGVMFDDYPSVQSDPAWNPQALRVWIRTAAQSINDFYSQLLDSSPKIRPFYFEMTPSGTYGAGELNEYMIPELPAMAEQIRASGLEPCRFTSDGFMTTVNSMRKSARHAYLQSKPGLCWNSLMMVSTGPTTYPSGTNMVSLTCMTGNTMERNWWLPGGDINDSYTNREVYTLINDEAMQGSVAAYSNSLNEVWQKDLTGADSHVVALINGNSTAQNITLAAPMFRGYSNVVYNLRDPWLHTNRFAPLVNAQIVSVPGYGVTLIKITPAMGVDGNTHLVGDAATNSVAGIENGADAKAGGRFWVLEAGAWVQK